MADDLMTPADLAKVRSRWPDFNAPIINSELLLSLSMSLRSQCLHSELFQLSHADLVPNLQAAQDDIASCLQLLEKRFGKQAA